MARKPPRRKPIKKAGAKGRAGRNAQGGGQGSGQGGGQGGGPSGAQGGGDAGSGGGQTIEGKADEPKKKQTNPFEFGQQVLSEGSKVTWTTRNETLISTVMVLIMVAIMAVFFLGVDGVLRYAVCNILPIECAARGGV